MPYLAGPELERRKEDALCSTHENPYSPAPLESISLSALSRRGITFKNSLGDEVWCQENALTL